MRPLLANIAAALLASAAPIGGAQAQTPVRMVLNWKCQGPQALFFLAEDRGYFADAGLDVTIDQGEGSAAAITKVATGTYDAGFGDINAVIQQAANAPDIAPVMVYQVYNAAPFSVLTKADSGIASLNDLAGRKVGGPPCRSRARHAVDRREGDPSSAIPGVRRRPFSGGPPAGKPLPLRGMPA